MKPFIIAVSVALTLALLCPMRAHAEDYYPITGTFTGTGALVLPQDNALNINGCGTIELWVSAGWDKPLTYDPAIMAYAGSKGPRFAIHLQADARALGVYAGTNYDTVPYNFGDGQLHYVALVIVADTIDVIVDGALQKTLTFGFAELPASNFTIGSFQKWSPFVGQIGQIRIWSQPLDLDALNRFKLRPIETTGPNAHPNLEALVGVSAFANPERGWFIFVGKPNQPNQTIQQ